MLGRVVGAFTVAIYASRGIKEFFLKGGATRAFTSSVVGGIYIVTQSAGKVGHKGETAEVKCVRYGVDRREDETVAFGHRPIDEVALSDVSGAAGNEPIGSGAS